MVFFIESTSFLPLCKAGLNHILLLLKKKCWIKFQPAMWDFLKNFAIHLSAVSTKTKRGSHTALSSTIRKEKVHTCPVYFKQLRFNIHVPACAETVNCSVIYSQIPHQNSIKFLCCKRAGNMREGSREWWEFVKQTTLFISRINISRLIYSRPWF